MKHFKVTIEGVTPMLMHRFTDEAQQQATSGTRGSFNVETRSPEEIAEAALYKSEGGEVIFPTPNLLACFTEGGKFFKAGRSKLTTQRSSLVPAAVLFAEPYYKLESDGGWHVDTRPIRNPTTGGRILRHRPIFHDWKLSFECDLDEEIIGEKLLRELIDCSGKRIGLGDYRPACKGPFGRFVVTSWKNGE